MVTTFFHKTKLQIKQILKSDQITNVIWEKIVTQTNYWIKTPREIIKKIAVWKINILQVWSFLDFISSDGNSDVESQQRFLQNVLASFS